MAERKDIEKAGRDAAASPNGVPKKLSKADVLKALPAVESPPLSPAEPAAALAPTSDAVMIDPIEEAPPTAPTLETSAIETPGSESAAPEVVPLVEKPSEPAPAARPRLAFNARHKRTALLAASVAIAAALGAVLGAAASGGFAKASRSDVAGLEERKAMQQSIAHLAREIITLKAGMAAANKSAHAQIAKIGDELGDKLGERLKREGAEITGSISAPETTSPASASQVATPIPPPRPPQRLAAAETSPARPPVLPGWSIRDSHDGYVYVEGHGDIYQVALGAPLPGLGPVQSIRREGGRWVVVTPKGLIVSLRDRRYFESF